MKILLNNCKLYDGSIVNILIKDKKINKVSSNEIISKNINKIVDLQNKLVLPGMVDIHTHMRDFNLSYKETFKTGSNACIKNGITTFCDMPNSIPPTTTIEMLNKKIDLSINLNIKAYFFIGLDEKSNYKDVKKMCKKAKGIKIFLNESTGKMNFNLSNLDKRIFNINTLYLFHAENESILDIPKYIKNINRKIHICHISSKKEYEYAKELKKTYKNLTYEFAPHHMFLDINSIKNENISKVKPFLKSKEDKEFILNQFILDDQVIYATDHAPHTIEEKIEKGLYGFPGVDTSLKLLINLVKENKIDYQKIINAYSYLPSKILGLKKVGKIQKNFLANIIVIDENYNHKIKNEDILSKSKWTPFENWKFSSKVIKTIYNGKIIYEE